MDPNNEIGSRLVVIGASSVAYMIMGLLAAPLNPFSARPPITFLS